MSKVVMIDMARGRGDEGAGGGGGGADLADWTDRLVRTRDGQVKSSPHNVMLILQHDPDLARLFWLDEFGNRVCLDRDPPWPGGTRNDFTEVDALELAAWIGEPTRYGGLALGIELVMQCVEAVARRRPRHPVREYLQSLRWDGKPRVANMFVELFGAEASEYVQGIAQCFMVSAVSRILWADPREPSKASKVDFMLVLEGDQGAGKTTSVLELFGAQWYAEATESPASKDFYQALRGRWCVEIGEMDSFSKADVSKVKQAITTRFDTYRPSYGRTTRSFRRECVFVGTTNRDDYLRDETGGRRFLPLKAGKVDIRAIVAARDQLWAEAVHLYENKFEWWHLPSGAQREQDARYIEDGWTEILLEWLEGRDKSGRYDQLGHDKVDKDGRVMECSVVDLMTYALRLDSARMDRGAQIRVGSVMARLKWRHFRPLRYGERIRLWYRPREGMP